MTGKVWTAQQEAELRALVKQKSGVNLIAAKLGKSPKAVIIKCQRVEGDFYVGLDPAQTKDYHVLSVVESVDGKLLLRHLKIFPQPTYDATVLGYIKSLQDR